MGFLAKALVLYAGSEEILASASHHRNAAVGRPGGAEPQARDYRHSRE